MTRKLTAFAIPNDIEPIWPLFSYQEARRFGYHAGSSNYVYTLCYPSGLPFYVGRGVRYRCCQHVEEPWRLAENRWTEKHHLLMQLYNLNESEWYHFLALVESQEEAAGIEQHYIQQWGLRTSGGLLVNRARPVKYHATEPPERPKVRVSEPRPPRRVHHPDILAGEYDDAEEYPCAICLKACCVPRNLLAKPVQCPNCAHFFKPLNPHWKPAEIIHYSCRPGISADG